MTLEKYVADQLGEKVSVAWAYDDWDGDLCKSVIMARICGSDDAVVIGEVPDDLEVITWENGTLDEPNEDYFLVPRYGSHRLKEFQQVLSQKERELDLMREVFVKALCGEL